jgi:hypothetical protein
MYTVTQIAKYRQYKSYFLLQSQPLPACKPHAPPEEPAKTDLPLLPGGATILCHFWNSVVLRQSLGLSAYALWRDISSCIGSRITHSCVNEDGNVNSFDIQASLHCDIFWERREKETIRKEYESYVYRFPVCMCGVQSVMHSWMCMERMIAVTIT